MNKNTNKITEQTNLKEKLIRLKNYIKLNPNFEVAHYNLGLILQKLGKLNEAQIAYKKAIEIKPNFIPAYYNLANMQRRSGKLHDAEAGYKKILEIKPNCIEAHYNLGNTLKDLGKLDEAEINFIKVLDLKPELVEAHKNLDIISKQRKLLSNVLRKKDTNETKKLLALRSEFKLIPSPFICKRNIQTELVVRLNQIKSEKIDNNNFQDARFGNGKHSDFNLFDDQSSVIKNLKKDLISIMSKVVKSDVYIKESFFNILRSGSGVTPHKHTNAFDKTSGLINQKYSLTYYVCIGDQNCSEPGILKLHNPDEEILPTEGMVVIFEADRIHSATYNGNKDRVMIGVNFYSII